MKYRLSITVVLLCISLLTCGLLRPAAIPEPEKHSNDLTHDAKEYLELLRQSSPLPIWPPACPATPYSLLDLEQNASPEEIHQAVQAMLNLIFPKSNSTTKKLYRAFSESRRSVTKLITHPLVEKLPQDEKICLAACILLTDEILKTAYDQEVRHRTNWYRKTATLAHLCLETIYSSPNIPESVSTGEARKHRQNSLLPAPERFSPVVPETRFDQMMNACNAHLFQEALYCTWFKKRNPPSEPQNRDEEVIERFGLKNTALGNFLLVFWSEESRNTFNEDELVGLLREYFPLIMVFETRDIKIILTLVFEPGLLLRIVGGHTQVDFQAFFKEYYDRWKTLRTFAFDTPCFPLIDAFRQIDYTREECQDLGLRLSSRSDLVQYYCKNKGIELGLSSKQCREVFETYCTSMKKWSTVMINFPDLVPECYDKLYAT